jgi:hypothetical protein
MAFKGMGSVDFLSFPRGLGIWNMSCFLFKPWKQGMFVFYLSPKKAMSRVKNNCQLVTGYREGPEWWWDMARSTEP